MLQEIQILELKFKLIVPLCNDAFILAFWKESFDMYLYLKTAGSYYGDSYTPK